MTIAETEPITSATAEEPPVADVPPAETPKPVDTQKPATGLLSRVTIGGLHSPPRTMIYGVDGIGKSTWASQAPSAIVIPTEDGATRINVAQFPLCESWTQLFDNLRALYREPHGYKTVVLDSADWAQSLAVEHVCDTEFGGDMKKFDIYGRGYRSTMREWVKLLHALDYVHKHRGMEIILIAHAVIRSFKNPTGDDYDRYESNLISTPNTSLWAKTKEWCDMVLFANYEIIVNDVDDKTGKGKGILKKGDGQRVCYASPSASWDAKVRAGWSLPDKFTLSQETFRKHIGA